MARYTVKEHFGYQMILKTQMIGRDVKTSRQHYKTIEKAIAGATSWAESQGKSGDIKLISCEVIDKRTGVTVWTY